MSKQLKKTGKKPSSVPFPNKILDPTMTRPEALHTYFIRNCSSMMNHRRLLNSNSICCAKDWKLCFSKWSSTYWEKMTINFIHCCLFQRVTLQSQVDEGSWLMYCWPLSTSHNLQRGLKRGLKTTKLHRKNTTYSTQIYQIGKNLKLLSLEKVQAKIKISAKPHQK